MTKYTDWSLRVGSLGNLAEGLVDIHQAIRLILSTPKGSDPHRPDFGCDAWKYLDTPLNSAIPNVIREVSAAVEAWETRVTLESVTVTQKGQGWLQLSIRWTADGYEEVTAADLAVPSDDDFEYVENESDYMPSDFVE